LESQARTRLFRLAGALITIGISWMTLAQSGPGAPVDLANPLVGTAPLDRQELIGNAPPPGEPVYSGQTSPGARLPHSSVEAAPINNNIELSFPNGVPVPYYYTKPTMLGFSGGGGSTYGGDAQPIISPVVGDWSMPPDYRESYYDKTREKASPGYYSVYLDTFKTRIELTATRWASLMRFAFPASEKANVPLLQESPVERPVGQKAEQVVERMPVGEFRGGGGDRVEHPPAQLPLGRSKAGKRYAWGQQGKIRATSLPCRTLSLDFGCLGHARSLPPRNRIAVG